MENPILEKISKVVDIILLNILFLICSLPLITIGASLTALFSVTLKLVRDEETYIVTSFFKSLKSNFKISTVIWMIIVLIGVIFVADFKIIPMIFPKGAFLLQILLLFVIILYLIITFFIFPYIARFEDTLKNTIKNAFLIGIVNFPYFFMMLVIFMAVIGIIYILGIDGSAFLWMLFLFSAVAYLFSIICRKVFDQYEHGIEQEKQKE